MKIQNDFDLLIAEFEEWLIEQGLPRGSASSYKSNVKTLAQEINKAYGENWFMNFPLFYTHDNLNLLKIINHFIVQQKQDTKSNWNNIQSAFNTFNDFLALKYSPVGDDESDDSTKENSTFQEHQKGFQSEIEKSVQVKIPEVTDIADDVKQERTHNNLMSEKFMGSLKTQGRWYPDLGEKKHLLFPTKTINKIFSEANDDRWKTFLKNDLENMRILVGPNENDVRFFRDVQEMQWLKDNTFRVFFYDGTVSQLYTRTSDNKIIPEQTSDKGWGDLSVDHRIPLDVIFRKKINSLPTLIKITDMIIECLEKRKNEDGNDYNLHDEHDWYIYVYDVLSTKLKPLRNSLYSELVKTLDGDYELMDKNNNSSKGKTVKREDENGVLTDIFQYFHPNNTRIVIPGSIKKIAELSCNSNESIVSIEFGGTVAQWEAVKGKDNLLKTVSARVVKCLDGEWKVPGLYIEDGVLVRCYDKGVTSVEIPKSVTEIGRVAFEHCESLKSVVIPASVRLIDDDAFRWCCSLKSVEIPSSVRSIGTAAFQKCKSLKSVVIPESVSLLGAYAFQDCVSLSSVEIPKCVNEIDIGVFFGCTSLESVVIPNGVPAIGKRAFYNCTSLASVEIPESVEAIDEEAFGSCESLKSVRIPEGITTIRRYVFYGCKSLESVEIPESVEAIGEEAFGSCESLKSLTIPASITSISEDAFENCTSLEDVEFGCTLAEWKLNGWNETISAKIVKCSDDVWCKPSLLVEEGVVVECLDKTKTYIKIPAGVKRIGYEAFKDCSELMCVVIPTTVTTIDESAFDGCTSLVFVEYSGAKKAWEVVKERLKISKTVPAKVVKCSDGDVAL